MKRAALAALIALPLAGCNGCTKDDKGPPPSLEPAPPSPASSLPTSGPAPGSNAVIELVAARLGVAPLVPRLDDGGTKGDLLLFPVKGKDARALVLEHHRAAFDAGAYLFLFRPNADEAQALLGLAPTKDALEAVRIVGTRSHDPPHDPAAMVAWITDLDRTQPLGLTGIGPSFLEGGFDGQVKDPAAIAAKVDAFCPEFGQNLAAAHDEDARTAVAKWFAANRTFYFTWD